MCQSFIPLPTLFTDGVHAICLDVTNKHFVVVVVDADRCLLFLQDQKNTCTRSRDNQLLWLLRATTVVISSKDSSGEKKYFEKNRSITVFFKGSTAPDSDRGPVRLKMGENKSVGRFLRHLRPANRKRYCARSGRRSVKCIHLSLFPFFSSRHSQSLESPFKHAHIYF